MTSTDEKMSRTSTPASRRHSYSNGYLREYAPTGFQAPVKVLARSITQGTLDPKHLHWTEPSSGVKGQTQLPLIDVKFVELYVKKGRQNSEPGLVRPVPIVAKRASCGNPSSVASGKTPEKLPAVHEHSSSHLRVPTAKLHESTSDTNLRCISSRSPIGGRSPTCYRILESLYVGGTSAASNDALLHRLKIDHVIDLRKTPVRPGASNSVSPLPAAGHRKLLTLRLDQPPSRSQLETYFHQINTFITRARVQGKNVLLYDEEGRQEAPAAAVQYLMHYYRMRYSEAKDFVLQIIPDMQMPSSFEQALECTRDSSMEKSPKSTHLHQLPNGSTQCRNGLKQPQQKKQLAWA